MRKTLYLMMMAWVLPGLLLAQEKLSQKVSSFDKVVVSPHINVVLTQGDAEEVTIEYANVKAEELNIEVKGSTLHLFLDESRIIPKTDKDHDHNYRYDIYKDAEITAYVSFRHLSGLDIRGDQEVTSKSLIDAVQFKLKVYGANRVDLAGLDAQVLKVVSYGESEIIIREGKVSEQKYVLYGSSHVDASGITSSYSKAKMYGESQISLHASDELDISAFGEPIITYSGDPSVNKNIIIGEARLFRVN